MNKKMMQSALNNNRMLNGFDEMNSRLGISDAKAKHMITDMRSEKRVGARFRHMTMAIALLSLLLLPNLALAQPNATSQDCLNCHADWTTYTLDAAYPDPTMEWGVHYNGNDYSGSPGSIPVDVSAGDSFEVDFIYRDIADNVGGEGNVRSVLSLPSGWTAGPPVSNQQPISSGWKTVWEGFPWAYMGNFMGDSGSPDGWHVLHASTQFSVGSGQAYDNGSTSNPGDRDLVPEEMGSDVLITVPPGTTPGTYTIYVRGVGHVEGSKKTEKASVTGSFTVNVVAGANSSPTLTVNQPDGTGDSVTEGSTFNINYDLADTEQTVTVAFYYDTNNSGLDGVAAANCSAAPEGTGVNCAWDTNGVAPGDYFIYGITDDGIAAPVSDYSSGTVTVNAANTAPTLTVNQPDGVGDSVTVGSSFNINYDLADAEQTVTVAFYYDTNNSGLDGVAAANCSAAPEGSGLDCAWDTTGVTPGDYFIYGITDDGIAAQVSAYSSGTVTVNPAGGPDSLSVTDNTTLANSAVEGNIDVLMQRLEVDCAAGGGDDGICEIVEITIDDIGDAESPDINFMNIYIDTDTTFDANDSNRVDNIPFNGTAQNIGLTSIPLVDRQVTAGTPKYIWVTYDLDASSAGRTVQSSVTAVAVNTGSGDTSASGTWNSNSFAITAGGGPDSLSVTSNTPLANFATEGDTDVQMQRLGVSCTAGGGDDGICEITGITIDDLGSVTGTEIDNLNIYIDTDTTFSGSEPSVADATFTGVSTAIDLTSIAVGTRQVTAGTPKYIWVTYDLAAGSAPATVQTSLTAIGVNTGSGDTGAAGTWNSNGFAIAAVGSGLGCSDCHDYPPLDGTRDGSTGAVVGDHQTPAHLAATCNYCHVVPATAGHRNGDIEMKDGTIGDAGIGDNGTYSKGAIFAQNNSPTTGTCSNIDCHNNAVTPQWGVGIIDHVARSYATGGATPCMNCHDDSANGANWTVEITHLNDCTICHTTIPTLQGGLVAGVCTGCHTDAWAVTHTTNTPDHNSLVTVSGTTAGWTNCGNCHSDPPPLVDNGDVKVHNACGSCHDVDGGLISTAVGKAFTTGGNCETCHGTVDTSATFSSTHSTHTSAHAVALDTVNDLSNGQHCGNCHVVSTWTEIEGTEHNVATNGAGSCATCHNSPTQTVIDIIADVSTVGGTANCLDCHSDKTASHGSVDHVAATYVTLGGTQEYYNTTCASCHDPGGAENATVDVTHGGDCSLCHTTVPNLQPGLPTGGGPNDCVNCHTGGVHTLWGRFQDTCAGDYGPESCHATFQGPGTSVHDAHNVNWDTPADDETDRANATVGVDDQPMIFPYGTAPDYWQPNWPLTPTCATCHTSYLNPLVSADGVGCNVCHKFKTNKKEFMHTYHEGDMAIDCQYCHYND